MSRVRNARQAGFFFLAFPCASLSGKAHEDAPLLLCWAGSNSFIKGGSPQLTDFTCALFLSKKTQKGQRLVRRVYSRHTLPSSSPSGQSVLKSQSLSSGISGPLLQWYWPSSVMFMLGEDAKQRRKKYKLT